MDRIGTRIKIGVWIEIGVEIKIGVGVGVGGFSRLSFFSLPLSRSLFLPLLINGLAWLLLVGYYILMRYFSYFVNYSFIHSEDATVKWD